MDDEFYQIIILTLRDGRKVQYTGQVQLTEENKGSVTHIEVTPPIPLPPGCTMERIKPDGEKTCGKQK